MPKKTDAEREKTKNILRELISQTGSESPSFLKRRMKAMGFPITRHTIRTYKKEFGLEEKLAQYESKKEANTLTKQEQLRLEKTINKKRAFRHPDKENVKPIYENGMLINRWMLLPPCFCGKRFKVNRFNKNESKICIECGTIFRRDLWKWLKLGRHSTI